MNRSRKTTMERRHNPLTLVEDVLIILAIFSLWPTILGWQGIIFKVIQFSALGVLLVILTRRIGRIKGSHEKSD